MKAIALIPARYGSSRFPGKPLARLGGKRVIERVCDRVAEAGIRPVVATDDERILHAVEEAGYEAVMTSTEHRSGTDRIREALDRLEDGDQADVIINVQGDEPFIQPEQLKSLMALFEDPAVELATLIKRYDPTKGIEGLLDPNLVKVVTAENGDALYFSRSVIPFVRGQRQEEWLFSGVEFHTHIGVYAYRPAVLKAVTALPQTELEKTESLEQLRWLGAGYRIRTLLTEGTGVGIDTPEDLANAEKLIANEGLHDSEKEASGSEMK